MNESMRATRQSANSAAPEVFEARLEQTEGRQDDLEGIEHHKLIPGMFISLK